MTEESKKPPVPHQGGSYIRDKATGKLTRVAFTKPAEPSAVKAAVAPAADIQATPAPAKAPADKKGD